MTARESLRRSEINALNQAALEEPFTCSLGFSEQQRRCVGRTGDLEFDINIRSRRETATNFFTAQGVAEGLYTREIMTAIETVESALALAHVRRNTAPKFDIFASIVNQLEYLVSVLRGDEKDRSRLKDIIVGHFAIREFEESDPELAEALTAAQSSASKAAKGLRV